MKPFLKNILVPVDFNESDIPLLSLTASAATFNVEDFFKAILEPVVYFFKNERY